MTGRRPLLAGAALGALLLGGCGGAGGGGRVALEPGQWEMTMRIVSLRGDNLPPEMSADLERARVNGSRTSRDCMYVTADVFRIENLRFTVPQPGRAAAGCRIPELAMEGGRVSGRLSCEGIPGGRDGQTVTLSGEMNGTYSADAMDVTMQGRASAGGWRGSAEVRFTGRRLGACPAPPVYRPPVYAPPTPMPMPAPPPAANGMMPDR